MKAQSVVKLIKKKDRKTSKPQAKVEPAVGENRWSTAVKSWVSEFQKHGRDEGLPAFKSVFPVPSRIA